MSEQEPPDWFEKSHRSSREGEQDEAERRRRLERELPRLLEREHRKGRAERFLPYLLIRTVLGDRGDRPINVPHWESPDIWTAPGDPSVTPLVPPDHGGTVTAGQPATLYAHVWNLGFAPLVGVRVEFSWVDPSIGVTNQANFIGEGRCELAGRGMQGSHKLVKCPVAWVPTFVNGGHECLFARVSGIGDPIGGNPWSPTQNRHVGQRNIAVVPMGSNVSNLIMSLDASRPAGARLLLLQVGPAEGELARHIAGRRLKLTRVATRILGEIDPRRGIVAGTQARPPAAALAPVHPLAARGVASPPSTRRSDTRVVDPAALLTGLDEVRPRRGSGRERPPRQGPHLAELMTAAARLNREAGRLPPPRRGEAQALRIATAIGDRLIGGYTILVTGR